jgi:ParB family chromosome partitioning protein
MKIALADIHPASQPVRTSWDEAKLDELAQSIKEQGLIVPIKVRPNGGGYEVVYGHRRLEAARRAGLGEVESFVEGVNDTSALIQALIENIQREDMEPMDIARSLKSLQGETGWSAREISRKGILSHMMVSRYLLLLDESPEVQNIIYRQKSSVTPGYSVGERHVRATREAGLDRNERAPVLKKAASEGLSYEQTRGVAESVRETKDPRRRKMLIETPYSSFQHDPDMNRERAERYGASDPLSHSKEPSIGEVWEMTIEVKMMLDYFKSSRKMAQEALKMDDMGKFSPEAREFVARKARIMVEAWQGVVDRLEAES